MNWGRKPNAFTVPSVPVAVLGDWVSRWGCYPRCPCVEPETHRGEEARRGAEAGRRLSFNFRSDGAKAHCLVAALYFSVARARRRTWRRSQQLRGVCPQVSLCLQLCTGHCLTQAFKCLLCRNPKFIFPPRK